MSYSKTTCHNGIMRCSKTTLWEVNLIVLVTCHKVLQCWKTRDFCCALLLFNSHLNLKKLQNWPTAWLFVIFSFFFFFFLQIEFLIIVNKMALNFFSKCFWNYPWSRFKKSSSKTNSKSYLKVRVPENQRNLQNGNFRTICKTLNSHKVRLNGAMNPKFSGNTSLIEVIK